LEFKIDEIKNIEIILNLENEFIVKYLQLWTERNYALLDEFKNNYSQKYSITRSHPIFKTDNELMNEIIKDKYEKIRNLSEKMTSKRIAERPNCEEILNDKVSWTLPSDIRIKTEYDQFIQKRNKENMVFLCNFMEVKLKCQFDF
jgi:hypothetical protein